VTVLKPMLGYDDSLDMFGVHGVGGVIGILATGVLAFGPLTASAVHPAGTAVEGAALLRVQAVGVAATQGYGALGSFLLLKLTDLPVGLRAPREAEREGLDIVLHGEQVF
jgi:Amt family ammonium transporter